MSNLDCPDINDGSSVEDVVLHMLRLHLGGHTFTDVADTFREEFVSGKVFVRLGKQDLNDLGIFQFQRRKALYDHIQSLRLKQELVGTSEVFTFTPSGSQSIPNQPEDNSFASFLDEELDALHLNYSSLDSPQTRSSDFNTFPMSTLGYSKAIGTGSGSTIHCNSSHPMNPLMQIHPHSDLDLISNSKPMAIDMKSINMVTVDQKEASSVDSKATNNTNSTSIIPNMSGSEKGQNLNLNLDFDRDRNGDRDRINAQIQQIAIDPMLNDRNRNRNRTQIPSKHCISSSIQDAIPKEGKWKNVLKKDIDPESGLKSKLKPKLKTKSVAKSNGKLMVKEVPIQIAPKMIKSKAMKPMRPKSKMNSIVINNNSNLNTNSKSNTNSTSNSIKKSSPGILTESYNDNLAPRYVASENVAKFTAVFRGINVAKFIYLLMDPSQIKALDAIIAKKGKKELKPAEWISMGQRTCLPIQRSFYSTLNVKYVSDGWLVANAGSTETVHMPFNPICVFTLNLNRNEVISMNALSVIGYVHNVRSGAMWITSSLNVLATEKRSNNDSPEKCGEIVDIEFVDNRKMEANPLEVSYMVQDHVYSMHQNRDLQVEKLRVRCCLKLSTRTNKRVNGSNRKVYVQSWNVRPTGRRARRSANLKKKNGC